LIPQFCVPLRYNGELKDIDFEKKKIFLLHTAYFERYHFAYLSSNLFVVKTNGFNAARRNALDFN